MTRIAAAAQPVVDSAGKDHHRFYWHKKAAPCLEAVTVVLGILRPRPDSRDLLSDSPDEALMSAMRLIGPESLRAVLCKFSPFSPVQHDHFAPSNVTKSHVRDNISAVSRIRLI